MIQFGDPRVADRIWGKLAPCPITGCWIVLCALNSGGYGITRIDGRMQAVHRYLYGVLVAPLPPWRATGDPKVDVELDHVRCQMRACANPDHVEPVPSQINTLRGASPAAENARKDSCPRGHLYTPENTRLIHFRGREARRCIECAKARDRERVRIGGVEAKR